MGEYCYKIERVIIRAKKRKWALYTIPSKPK